MTRGWMRFAAWTLAVAGALLAAEWGLRRGGYEYSRLVQRVLQIKADVAQTHTTSADLYRYDPHQIWAPRPGALLPWTNGERINPDGYRGPQLDVERKKGVLRIAFLGGATTLGVGVRYDDTYAALSTRLIGERAMQAECMDAGVEGFSVRQSLERYRDLVRPYRPHVVVLSITFRACYRQATESWTDDERIRAARDFAGDPSQFPDHWPRSRLLQFGHWLVDALDGRYWSERDFDFQQMRLAATSGELDWPGVRRVPIDDFYHSLSLLLQETRQDGAHLALISIPPGPGAYIPPVNDVYQQVVADFAQREKLVLLDGRSAYLEALRDDIPKEDLFQSDDHPSECGHLQLAEALAQEIVRGIESKSTAHVGTPIEGPDKQ